MDAIPDHALHAEALCRAQCGLRLASRIRYGLGHGGFHPEDPAPTRDGRCDCSGFVSWCMGLSRDQRKAFGMWISTTHIWNDGLNRQRLFVALSHPFPGCLVAYPDRNGKQGHVGIVASLTPYEGIEMAVGGLRKRSFRFFSSKDARWFAVREGALRSRKEA